MASDKRKLFETVTGLCKATLVLVLTIFIASASGQAQSIWGLGLIVKESTPAHAPGDFPKVRLYENEDGTNEIDNVYFDGQSYRSDNFSEGKIFTCIELQCESPTILVLSETEESVSVFLQRTQTKVWFRKVDIKNIGWDFKYYIDLLTPKPDTISYSPRCYALRPLNLREGPSTDFPVSCKLSPLIKEENKPVFEIISLGIRSDNWLKVRVHQYNQSDCLDTMSETVLLKTFEGWIKAVDDKTGAPNIWFDSCCEFL